jgi:hypothetical protein
MNRFSSLYRLARALKSVWAYHPPRGVQVFCRVMVTGRWMTVILTDGDTYVQAWHAWTELDRATIHRKLDEAAAVLADQRKLTEAQPAPWTCPALAEAGRAMDLVVQRQKEEMRRRREIIPIQEGSNRKGGA